MKKVLNLILTALLLSIPLACACKTIAYSPAIAGQPLIFHVNTKPLSQFSAVNWTQLQNALLIRSSYSHHLENLCNRECCADWNFWADGMGQWQQQTSHQDQFGFHDSTGGLTIGADTCYNDFLLGVAASYTNSNLRWKKSAGKSQINSYYGGLYGSWSKGCFYVNASAIGAFNEYQTSRHLHFRTSDRHAHARHNGWEVLTGIEVGALLQEPFCNIDLIPFIGIDYVYLSQQGFKEHNAFSSNLNVKRHSDQFLQSELGLQFMRRIPCEFYYKNWTIAPNLTLSYINQASLAGRSYFVNFVGSDHVFNVKGWDFERNLGAISFSFNLLNCTETVSFTLYYDGQFGKNYWNQAGSIMCNFCF